MAPKGLFYSILFISILLLHSERARSQSVERSSTEYLSILMDFQVRFDTSRTLVVERQPDADHSDDWKEWHLIENFTFGKDRGALPMIADLEALHPVFRDKVVALIQQCKQQGIELAVVETFRTHAKQSEYFTMGRKYTRSTGGKSKHQYGLAVDVVPIVDSLAVWDNTALWKKIGLIGEKLGLRWGGRWRAPYDPAHFEWLGGVTTYDLARGINPVVPRAIREQYPCIDEEIILLEQFYYAWEIEQAVVARAGKQAAQRSGVGQQP